MEKNLGNCQPFQEMSEMTTFQYPVLLLPTRTMIPASRRQAICLRTMRLLMPNIAPISSDDAE